MVPKNMLCVVIGVIPPDPLLADQIRLQTTVTVDSAAAVATAGTTTATTSRIHWQSSYSLAPDQDRHGAMTMLLTAILEDHHHEDHDRDHDDSTIITADDVVDAVQTVVHDYYIQHTNHGELEQPASVELWATAPAPLPLAPCDGYGQSFTVVVDDMDTATTSSTAVTAMRTWGLVLQPQVLSEQAIVQFRHVVDQAITETEQALAIHHPDLVLGQDSFLFQEIAARNSQRFDLRLQSTKARQLVHQHVLSQSYHVAFLRQAMGLTESFPKHHQDDHDADDEADHDDMDFDLSVVYSRPGAGIQGWHADGNHLASSSGGASDASGDNQHNPMASLPYAICLFIPLIDLNESVGYTQFWPGSHQHCDLVGFGPVATLTHSVWNASPCPAGHGIWYDYRLLHQGMPNISKDTLRPILQIIFKKKWYIEKSNYGTKSLYPDR